MLKINCFLTYPIVWRFETKVYIKTWFGKKNLNHKFNTTLENDDCKKMVLYVPCGIYYELWNFMKAYLIVLFVF
jgi:hypothetical protein